VLKKDLTGSALLEVDGYCVNQELARGVVKYNIFSLQQHTPECGCIEMSIHVKR
jgi:hypothetical protein